MPEIRFPGFTEDWEQRKFKEFSKKTGKEHERFRLPAYSVSNKAGLISQTEQFDGSRLDDLEKQIINSLNQMNSPIIQQE